jgi:hypothetical protein
VFTFDIPTQYNAPGQEHIKYEEDKVKIKVDHRTVDLEQITSGQYVEIVVGWVKYVTNIWNEYINQVRA